jgi:chromosome partitioning protein
MRKITVINQKGGTGKTTTAVNLGAALSEMGREVLLVDLDPQAGLTESLGVETSGRPTVAEVLTREVEPREAFHALHHFTVLPSSPVLAETEKRILRERPSDYPLALKDALAGMRGFDFVIVDCPPSLGALSLMGMVYSGSLLIPLQTQYMALNGLEKILGMMKTIREAGFPMEILGILPCMYDVRTSLSRQVEEHLRETLRDKVFRTVIRQSVSLAEAPARSKDVLSYQPGGRGAEDYRALAQEVLRHG